MSTYIDTEQIERDPKYRFELFKRLLKSVDRKTPGLFEVVLNRKTIWSARFYYQYQPDSIKTIFDTLNAKAALFAIGEYLERAQVDVPVFVSGTLVDLKPGEICTDCYGFGYKITPMVVPCRFTRSPAKSTGRTGDMRLEGGYTQYYHQQIDFPKEIKPELEDIVLTCEFKAQSTAIGDLNYCGVLRVINGFLIKQVNANYIIRGLRTSADFEFEKSIAQNNKIMADDIETIFILPIPELSAVNSTIVRDIIRNGGDATRFVPDCINLKM